MDLDSIRRMVDCQLLHPSRHAEDAGLARRQSLARNEAGLLVFGAILAGLAVSGLALGASQRLLPHVILWHR